MVRHYKRGRSRRYLHRLRKLKIAIVITFLIAFILSVMWLLNIPLITLKSPSTINCKINTNFIATLDYIKFTPQSKYLRLNFSYVSFSFIINGRKYKIALVKFKPGKEVMVNKGVNINEKYVGKEVFLKIYDNVSKISYPVGKFIHSPITSAPIHTFLYDALISAGYRNTSLTIRVDTKVTLILTVNLIIGNSKIVKVYRVAPGSHTIKLNSVFSNYRITAVWSLGPLKFSISNGIAYLRIQDNISLKLLIIVLYVIVVLLLVFSRKVLKSK